MDVHDGLACNAERARMQSCLNAETAELIPSCRTACERMQQACPDQEPQERCEWGCTTNVLLGESKDPACMEKYAKLAACVSVLPLDQFDCTEGGTYGANCAVELNAFLGCSPN
jgi:hypothetical protein